ncbi:MAG: hypothetical protein A3J48_01505 [Candidatus Doudnabacteria bacterium RIFCSPHIGHO2_02_FULL_46_11]|uniref:TraC-like domain-containing protein n=1 Tax=Candidatus Doudnabacteria bacterium RIFCSPHIGHO2_02_FULL_46_11 TaxID=1817832 RepID=A0A1F5P8V8_9BACT|nr:MAG: hypothetical protein A3J48_01505 [Candidatus Doudnabacteria bacterium RIFCSPHIGHO2_02_FULL_46_11]
MALFGKNKNDSNGAAAAQSTQSFLDVAEVRDGVIMLKDGNLRGVLAVSSVNFSLKSDDEQNAIISSYQSFLNSLESSVQILVQSRKTDITPYIDMMKNRMSSVSNQLLQMQMAEYIEFITRLTDVAHIMTKTFYVIVPFNLNNAKQGFFGKVGHIFNPRHSVVIDAAAFEANKKELLQRMAEVAQRLSSTGLNSKPLETAEVVELLYSSYNVGSVSGFQGSELDKLDLQ